MKNQQVNVDFWAMGKAMLIYLGMTAIGWVMLRLINTVLMLPRTMRSQGENLQNTLNELQVSLFNICLYRNEQQENLTWLLIR